MINNKINLVGILNITPDSFSDGGDYFDPDRAVSHARRMLSEGADVIDIGGDSTGPESTCVGPEEEWRRIGDVVGELSRDSTVSVDTHHSEVAEKAIRAGAAIINDISAGSDPKMFPLIAERGTKIVLMCVRSKPHCFEHLGHEENAGSVVSKAIEFLERRISAALESGITREQLILDPGMGFFIAKTPAVSWELMHRFDQLQQLELPLMFADSRKGFLKQAGETDIKERDPLSALSAVLAAQKFRFEGPHFIRVHDVALHTAFLQRALENFLISQ